MNWKLLSLAALGLTLVACDGKEEKTKTVETKPLENGGVAETTIIEKKPVDAGKVVEDNKVVVTPDETPSTDTTTHVEKK